ncbi:MAG: lysylphosphatidylglycerol synthase transmembrane domain-containing protein [Miltoncostaeaceae bacterium]
MNSFQAFFDAAREFGGQLASVAPVPLALALACSLANLLLRSRAWQNILRASYPDAALRYRDVARSYLAGVGVNEIIPARVGDVVKLFLVKRRAPKTRYPGLAASLVVETMLDWVIGIALLVWALQAGVLPGLPRLPSIPAFDLSLVARNPIISGIVLGILLVGLIALSFKVRSFWQEFGAGLVILKTPGRYLRRVVGWQLLAFGSRLAGAYFFLVAFHVPAALEGALIVQAAGALASLFPATPGGLGPKQALLVVMLAGTASRSEVLAFSVGTELTLVVFNAVVGLIALVSLTGGFHIRRTVAAARSERSRAGR